MVVSSAHPEQRWGKMIWFRPFRSTGLQLFIRVRKVCSSPRWDSCWTEDPRTQHSIDHVADVDDNNSNDVDGDALIGALVVN